MIQTATPESFENYTPRSEAGVRILSLVQAYGVEQSFLRFWRGEYGSAISLMDGPCRHRTPAGGTGRAVHFSDDAARGPVGAHRRGKRPAACGVMAPVPAGNRCRPDSPGPNCPYRPGRLDILPAGDLPDTPNRLWETLPAFDAWYADVSHRMRHGVCRAAVVREMGRARVACAMTVAQARDGAVLGAVATLPDYRSRGYASACVTTLAAVLQGEGRRIDICPKNEGARRLYERLGFSFCGSWGELRRYSSPSA